VFNVITTNGDSPGLQVLPDNKTCTDPRNKYYSGNSKHIYNSWKRHNEKHFIIEHIKEDATFSNGNSSEGKEICWMVDMYKHTTAHNGKISFSVQPAPEILKKLQSVLRSHSPYPIDLKYKLLRRQLLSNY
jgi:hypothetical protein